VSPQEMWTGLGLQCLGFLVGGAAVSILTRLLRIQTQTWPFAQPRSTALWGLGAVSAGWLAVTILFLALMPADGTSKQDPSSRSNGLTDVMGQAVTALLLLGPAFLAMRRRREPWASVRVWRHNLGSSLIVGAFVALLTVVSIVFDSERDPGQVIARLGSGHLWAFLQYGVVGFGEELAFRGYLQTRLVAWLGRAPGWVLASVLMALAHVGQRLTVGGMSRLDALGSSASLIPISLFLGYVMLRTENIVAPAVAHTFANWVGTLGQLSDGRQRVKGRGLGVGSAATAFFHFNPAR
jgi:membrane protease YdiL (CAAX protease family)